MGKSTINYKSPFSIAILTLPEGKFRPISSSCHGGHHGTAEAPVDFLQCSMWTATAGDHNSRPSNGPGASSSDSSGLGMRLGMLGAWGSTKWGGPLVHLTSAHRIQSYVCNQKCVRRQGLPQPEMPQEPPQSSKTLDLFFPVFPVLAACS